MAKKVKKEIEVSSVATSDCGFTEAGWEEPAPKKSKKEIKEAVKSARYRENTLADGMDKIEKLLKTSLPNSNVNVTLDSFDFVVSVESDLFSSKNEDERNNMVKDCINDTNLLSQIKTIVTKEKV